MIPLANTTIVIERPREGDDPDDSPVVRPVAAGIRAHIGSPSGRDRHAAGDQQTVDARLGCDPCDLRHYDLVRDVHTNITYQVVWVTERAGLGLDHLEAGLRMTAGAST